MIDARSPREYAEDHIPCALNLPVVNNEEYAEVGTLHRNDTHAAYLIGVQYSLANISRHIEEVISRVDPRGRILVYCFRGGKRSKLWAENLRTIGYRVDVLLGGWKAYRRWVRASLEQFPKQFTFRVLAGSTGCGKTRLLQALERAGCQVLDLEGLANHRGSLIGAVPGEKQPTQKWFDTLLLSKLRSFDTEKPVWVEAESKKIGNIQLPTCLHDAIGRATPLRLEAPMTERIKLWREDYPHPSKRRDHFTRSARGWPPDLGHSLRNVGPALPQDRGRGRAASHCARSLPTASPLHLHVPGHDPIAPEQPKSNAAAAAGCRNSAGFRVVLSGSCA